MTGPMERQAESNDGSNERQAESDDWSNGEACLATESNGGADIAKC